MLILECSQECYGRTDGRKDGSVTISLRNFVGEGIKKTMKRIALTCSQLLKVYTLVKEEIGSE